MSAKRSDGQAVDVVLTKTVTKDGYYVEDGFFGFAMQDGVSGETIALEIAQVENEIVIDQGVTALKGDVLYINVSGEVTNSNTDKPFMKVTVEKDANNVVWGILLPQA